MLIFTGKVLVTIAILLSIVPSLLEALGIWLTHSSSGVIMFKSIPNEVVEDIQTIWGW